MARKANIFTTIDNAITRGEVLILSDGTFVTEEKIKVGLKDEFMKELKSGKLDVSLSFKEYEEKMLSKVLKAEELKEHLLSLFGIETPAEPAEPVEPVTAPAEKQPSKKGKGNGKGDVNA